MDGRRLRVSVDESRQLFQNLLREARKSYREYFPEGTGSEDDENWQSVDREVRSVYEMARFALEVDGVPTTDDIDDFRGFCEDVDGLEPVDRALLNGVGQLTVQINDQLLANAEYRRKIPRVVERSFRTYVDKKRRFFDELETQEASVARGAVSDPAPGPESETAAPTTAPQTTAPPAGLVEGVSPETMLDVLSDVSRRLHLAIELLESV